MCRANDAMIKRTQDCRVNINIKEARNLIMKARLEMGWISKEDYEKELSDQE